MLLRAMLIIVSLLLAASLACQAQDKDGLQATSEEISGLTPEGFFSRLEEAITREGFVFHTSIEQVLVGPQGTTLPMWTVETWLELERGLAHSEFLKDPAFEAELDDEATIIVLGDTIYISVEDEVEKAETRICPGTRYPPLNMAFGCAPIPGVALGRVEADVEYEGQAAVALVYEERVVQDESLFPQEPYTVITSFYVDREGFLPLAWVTEFRADTGEVLSTLIASYENDFVPLASLPSDFFDPASIGYVVEVEEDPAAPLDDPNLGVTVYWLGREFLPPGNLPPLVLAESLGVRPPGGGPGDRATLWYRPRVASFSCGGFRTGRSSLRPPSGASGGTRRAWKQRRSLWRTARP